jgi:transposase
MPNNKYPPEIRERAVRLVLDHEQEYPSQWKAICSIADKSDLNRETLRQWVRQRERDAGRRPGLTTDERKRLADLERGNKELKRANETSHAVCCQASAANMGGKAFASS